MIAVFDSNVWIKEFGLNSALGALARFRIKQKGIELCVPEVIKLEVESRFRSDIKKYVSDISKSHRQLLTLFGSLKEVVLPTESEIESKVSQIFSGLGIDIIERPFSFESAYSSFLKTINKLPPSDGPQQFKDGVLWADCCSLLEKDDLRSRLITSS